MQDKTDSITNYGNIYSSCYSKDKIVCNAKVKEHSFIYVKSGLLELKHNNKIYNFGNDDCVFVRRSHDVQLTKKPLNDSQPFAGVFFQTKEVLQIRILTDMPHRPLVAALQSLLDDERAQCDPGRMCRMAVVQKLPGIGLLSFIPRHQIRQLHPLIVLVQLAIRKHKILNPHLSVHTIHTYILQNCTPFPGFSHDSRAVIIAHFVGKCSDFNAFWLLSEP